MASTRGTNIGPLKSIFTPPPGCSVVVAQCNICTNAWQAQQCYSVNSDSAGAEDIATCWPPAAATVPTPAAPLAGWGYYSPGLNCPSGYTSACTSISQKGSSSAVSLANTGTFQFALTAGETAVGCCPSGYSCGANGDNWQTCISVASSATFPAVTCDAGTSGDLRYWTIPFTTTSAITVSTVTLWAPLIQINWQSSDRPVTTPTISSTSSPTSSTTSSTVSSTTASPTPSPSLSGGLSSGAKIAIGVVIPVIFLLALGAAFFFFRKMQRRKKLGSPGSDGVHYVEVSADHIHELDGPQGVAIGVKVNPDDPQELAAHHGPFYELGSPASPNGRNKPATTVYQ